MEGFRCCYYLVIWIDFTGTGAVCVAPEGSLLLDIKAHQKWKLQSHMPPLTKKLFCLETSLGEIVSFFFQKLFFIVFFFIFVISFLLFFLLKRRLCDRNPWAITFGVVHFHQESHYSYDSLYPSDTSVWGYSSQLPILVYSLARNSQKT